MRITERLLMLASTALLAIAVPGAGIAAGMGGGAMGGAMMGGGMAMSSYSAGAMMPRAAGASAANSKDAPEGMGNVSISGTHVVKLSEARKNLPKIDRSIGGTLVPVPEMPNK